MTDQEPYTLCPYCKRRVDPDQAGVVYARKPVDLAGFGQTHDWQDGEAAFFHPECSPEAVGYRRRPRPGPDG
jgi:hypothetical protein